MPSSGDKVARKRLGKLLVQARFEMNPDWRNRRLFAEEQGINYRLVQDIETDARQNFDETTKMFIETKYGWALGSIDRVLAGGDPVKAAQVPPQVLALIIKVWGDFASAPEHIRTFAEADQFPSAFRQQMIQGYADRIGRRSPGRRLREA